MTSLLAAHPVPAAIAALVAGLLLGLVHFGTLRRVTELYLSGGALWRPLALQLARLAVLAAALVLCALAGALPLLAGALGLLLGRAIVLRRTREAR
ncbi:N-ATPase subunit AtpR [Pseudooceanicola sp. 502str34]|uniref:N-ATPase subunit AtpR n=1 Tax=Maritimibacter alkaliphilus TaxID=404236 RepID=UPI0021BD8600|nr:ATP synthase subunit I [Maritimibacter alkaliphilus]